MARVPVAVPARPFGVCIQTNLMNTDGFFVVNLGNQILEARVVNTSGATLPNVRVYVESTSDPGIGLSPVVVSIGDVPAGAEVPVRFHANFAAAQPTATRVSLVVEADGFEYRRVIKKIFVTKITYDKTTKRYGVVMPEGEMRVVIHSAIMGGGGRDCDDREKPFVVLPQDVTYEWVPTPPYEGTHGPFPYEDPWWKIALGILAGALALGALLYDYFSDGTLDGGSVSVKGTFEETDPSVSCCTSVSTTASSGEDDYVARGLYSAAGGAATIAIASDDPDPHYRGQEATPPGAGELTTSEAVRLRIRYPEPPSPGRPYRIEGDWDYVRTTDVTSYSTAASDVRQNLHYLDSYEVDVPATHDRSSGPLVVCARFLRPDGKPYRGGELYVTGVLVSTYGAIRRFTLADDGRVFDREANDGLYCGHYRFGREGAQDRRATKVDLPGTWYLFVFAQDVNTVAEGTDPFTAAHTIGGLVVTPQLTMAFDSPCSLDHDAVIQVV